MSMYKATLLLAAIVAPLLLSRVVVGGAGDEGADDARWKEKLTPAQFHVCREGGTEPPFSGKYDKYEKEGVYHCSSCGAPLFSSGDKFDSRTGWPSFTRPVDDDAVELRRDSSFGMIRTEVVCKKCDAHLGHLFDDGPKPTGKRYCINSVCLLHEPAEEEAAEGPAGGGG